MTNSGGYALDLSGAVRHVATKLDKAWPDGPALSLDDLVADYKHVVRGDLARVKAHEGMPDEKAALRWIIALAVKNLGTHQVKPDGDGYRLAKPFDKLKWQGRKVYRTFDRNEDDDKRLLRALKVAFDGLPHEGSFRVQVKGPMGGTQSRVLSLHPLARAVPPMGEEEFLLLSRDVAANGVVQPLVAMGDQVIDGRHRLAIASVLKKPVRVDKFEGDEEAARERIVSLNLVRRHLSTAQRALMVMEFFLPEAEAEAKQRQSAAGEQHGRGLDSLTPNGVKLSPGKQASEMAAERSHGLATARTMERMTPVRNAPETRERIRTGEIKTATAARRAALEETRSDEPKDVGILKPLSVYDYLGKSLYMAKGALARLEDSKSRTVASEQIQSRIEEIQQVLEDVRKLAGEGS